MPHGRARGTARIALAVLVAFAPAAAGRAITPPREHIMTKAVSVRETPFFGGRFVGKVESGARVALIEEKDGWIRLRHGELEGWLRAHDLGLGRSSPASGGDDSREPARPASGDPADAATAAEPRPDPHQRKQVAALAWNTRRVVVPGPGPTLEDPVAPAPPRVPAAVAEGGVVEPSRALHVRARPDWGAQLVGRIAPHQRVEVLSVRADWSRVEGPGGLSGWVRTAALTAPPLRPAFALPAADPLR